NRLDHRLNDVDDTLVGPPDSPIEAVPASAIDVVAPPVSVLGDKAVGESGTRIEERRRTTSAATAVATSARNPSSARRCFSGSASRTIFSRSGIGIEHRRGTSLAALFFLGCFCAILRSGNRLAGCNRLKLSAVHNILRLGLGRLRR